jgi:glycogen synthase
LRVLFLNYEYAPLGGGAGIATRALAHCLVDTGVQVDVLTSGWRRAATGTPSTKIDLERRSGGNGEDRLQVLRVPTSRHGLHDVGIAGAFHYVRAARRPLRRLLESRRYDAAHIFFGLPTGLLLSRVRAAGVPVVLSLRGSDVPGYDTTKPVLQALHVLLRPLTRRIWRRADRVVALSHGLAELARQTSPTLQFEVIRNGVDPDLFHPPAVIRTPGPVRFLSVARLIQRKNLSVLLDAWSRLERRRYRLEIVGSGPQSAALRERVTELGLDDEVTFAGAMDHAALAHRYRAADVFALTPTSESFGNVFAEAMASGLPVVGSRVGGIPEYVTHLQNGLLVAPENPAELAAALATLGEDSALRHRMAEANRRKALDELRWSVAASRYLEIYESLTARAPSRAGEMQTRPSYGPG